MQETYPDKDRKKNHRPGWMRVADITMRTAHIAVAGTLFGGFMLHVPFGQMHIWHGLTILTGCGLLKFFTGDVEVRPSMLGKIATALKMGAVAWVLLQIPHEKWAVWAAGLFTLLSGIGYIWRGMTALGRAESAA